MGALSQALVNLESAVGQAGAINGLPQAAQTLRADLVVQMTDIVNAMKPIQGDVAWFVSSATPQLTHVESMIAAQPQAVMQLQGLATEATGVKVTVDRATTQITTIASAMTSTLGKLAALEGTLQSQLTGLQSALPNQQNQSAAAHSRMVMLAAGGLMTMAPFFAARKQYLHDLATVNEAEATISALGPQIAAVQLMAALFQNDIPTLLAKVNAVQNAAAQIAAVLPPLLAQGTATAAAIGALLAEVQAMGIDAS